MKNTVISIGKTIIIYLLFIFILNIICAWVLQRFYSDDSYHEIVFALLCNGDSIDGQKNLFFYAVIAFKNLIEGIALAILASFIFTYILNRDVKIVFPDKIILRRRTSEGSKGKLTLGVLIGNPGKRFLCDVKCNIHCIYIKQVGEIDQRNGETYLSQTVESINNYFRFSFEIQSLPKIFWQHYLEKHEDYVEKDLLVVTITGKTDRLGEYFRISKEYHIKDIIVDNRNPEKYFKKKVNPHFTLKEKTKIDWAKFTKYIEAGEDERKNIIDEIKKYAES